MGKYEREKGARFEKALANYFRERGYDARRGQQFCGLHGDADVVGLPGVHIEAKAVERLNLAEAYAQSVRDAKEDEVPVVIHKRLRGPVMITLELSDFMKYYEEVRK